MEQKALEVRRSTQHLQSGWWSSALVQEGSDVGAADHAGRLGCEDESARWCLAMEGRELLRRPERVLLRRAAREGARVQDARVGGDAPARARAHVLRAGRDTRQPWRHLVP